MSKIFGRWNSFEGMLEDFQESSSDYSDDGKYTETRKPLEGPVPTEDELLFASYGGGAYEGNATVLFKKDGKLYEASGSHCSCMGLENQWRPSEVTFEALALRVTEIKKNQANLEDSFDLRYGFLGEHEPEAVKAFMELVQTNLNYG